MAIQKHRVIGIVFPLLIFLGVIALDLRWWPEGYSPFAYGKSKELLLGIALGLLVWGTPHLKWLTNRTLLQKLRLLGLFVFVLWAGNKLLSVRSPSSIQVFDDGISMPAPVFSDALWTVIFLGVVIVSVWILTILKELVYVQQGKKTERNYRLLLIFIFLQIVYVMASRREATGTILSSWDVRNLSDTTSLGNIFFFPILLFAFINGFRCKWIHYLNKSQKTGFFFYFTLVYSFALLMLVKTPNVFSTYSVVVDSFFRSLILFYVIYSGVAILGILFLLPSAGLVDRRIKEIQSLQALSETIGSVFDMKELISKTMELSRKVVGSDMSWIELREDSGYRLAGALGVKIEDVEKIPNSVRAAIRKEGEKVTGALLINDLTKNKNTKGIRKWNRKAGSLLAAQIRYKQRELGVLYALKHDLFGFVEESRALFRAFADQVAVALENVNLVQVTVEQQVYREELRMAHEAQMRLLPREMPNVPGVELGAFCITANEIGGDFYDIIQVDNKRLDIVIGDVSGKGASAAFYMAELKGVIQALAPHYASPKKILTEMNGFLQKHFEQDTFVTLVYGIYFPVKKQIHLVRAGHPPVAQIRGKKVTWLETDGMGLGMASNDVFNRSTDEKILQLKKGDTLVFHTDGLIEARNKQGEEFGEALLEETLTNLKGEKSEEVLNEIRSCMENFTQGVPRHDDVTLVVFRILK